MASIERARLATYTPAHRRVATIRTGLLLISWIAAVAVLLLLVSGVLSPDISLAAKRQICFAGLLVVELAAVYQFGAYRRRT